MITSIRDGYYQVLPATVKRGGRLEARIHSYPAAKRPPLTILPFRRKTLHKEKLTATASPPAYIL
jgi:hypothetical protein